MNRPLESFAALPGSFLIPSPDSEQRLPVIGWGIFADGAVLPLVVSPRAVSYFVGMAVIDRNNSNIVDLSSGRCFETWVEWQDFVKTVPGVGTPLTDSQTVREAADKNQNQIGPHEIVVSAKVFKYNTTWHFTERENTFLFTVPPGQPVPMDGRVKKVNRDQAVNLAKLIPTLTYDTVAGLNAAPPAPEPDDDDVSDLI